ncbi:MAG: ABC transporter ATP-binding protein [Phycisphaerae bacterium]|nr:ABC transporter ATP-binding protein [Phycisphaerae bacterium]
MSEEPLILCAEGITKSYRMGASLVTVLKGTDLQVRTGEFLAIVGASGSGKSTLLHILGGLDRPDRGRVQFEQEDLSGFGARRLNAFRNQTVGFVFQFYHLLDELSVVENVCLPAMVSRSILGWLLGARRKATQRAMEVLDQMGLAARVRHKPWQLSGGERQRVAIARALMNRPRLLLADEPTGNLDSVTGNGILAVLEALNRSGQTIVMVTHDPHVAARAGRVVTLADGQIRQGR